MKIAAFNVQNLFERARVLDLANKKDGNPDWAAAKAILEDVGRLNALLAKDVYSAADKAKIVALLKGLGLTKADDSKFVRLRRNRGALLKRSKDKKTLEVVAGGRADWIGWVELVAGAVDENATRNTARVLANVDADIVAVVEAESRPSLKRFGAQVLKAVGARPYEHTMLIDGNDDRGIDVGLYVRAPIAIDAVRSHVDDLGADGRPIFSRDCPEFHLKTTGGKPLVVLVNHFKSKGHGTPAENDARRKAQAVRVREIYEKLRSGGIDHVAIAGDLNDHPASAPLAPLLKNGSDLKDASEHPAFDDGGYPGTYGNCRKPEQKFDYLLMSPALFARMKAGGYDRLGMWAGHRPARWPMFPELAAEHEAASDHAAIWAEIEL